MQLFQVSSVTQETSKAYGSYKQRGGKECCWAGFFGSELFLPCYESALLAETVLL